MRTLDRLCPSTWSSAVRRALLIGLAAFAATAHAGEDDLVKLRDITHRKCIEKQQTAPTAPAMAPGAIEQVCQCYAEQFVGRLRTNREFTAALAANDRAALARIVPAATVDAQGRSLMYPCVDRVREQYGSEIVTDPTRASRNVGLVGHSRSSYVDRRTATCVDASTEEATRLRLSPSQVSGYCRCVAEGIADRISAADVAAAVSGHKGVLAGIEAEAGRHESRCYVRWVEGTNGRR